VNELFERALVFSYASKDDTIYRFAKRAHRDEFVSQAGAIVPNVDKVRRRMEVAGLGASIAKDTQWKQVSETAQVLDESHVWLARKNGETDRIWKERVAKEKASRAKKNLTTTKQ
jgi:hypothetical protein